jgi:integral membrane protein
MFDILINKYKRFTPFTDKEAWGLFRMAAIAEAVGWTLLIIGILLSDYVFVGSRVPVAIAGRVHGTLFLVYITATLVLSPSQGWSIKRTIIAGVASVPPYGSLLFEQWAAYKRNRRHLSKSISLSTYYNLARLKNASPAGRG